MEFQESESDGNSGCFISDSSLLSVKRAAELLSVDVDELKQAMTTHLKEGFNIRHFAGDVYYNTVI